MPQASPGGVNHRGNQRAVPLVPAAHPATVWKSAHQPRLRCQSPRSTHAQGAITVKRMGEWVASQESGEWGRRRAGYVDVLRAREFRWVFIAQLLSLVGDRAAAVALAVLVFDRSRSPVLTATVFALTFLPHLFAAPLAVVADYWPRRNIMVICDLARIPLVLLMTVPGTPLPVLFLLLGSLTLFEVPFDAARNAAVPDMLAEDQVPVGYAIETATHQVSLVVGSVSGGLLVSLYRSTGACLSTPSLSPSLPRFSVPTLVIIGRPERSQRRRPSRADETTADCLPHADTCWHPGSAVSFWRLGC